MSNLTDQILHWEEIKKKILKVNTSVNGHDAKKIVMQHVMNAEAEIVRLRLELEKEA